MRCLLVYPEFPPSYWSGKYALNFIGKRSGHPPLGLITVAAMFPETYELRLVDMNVEPLTEEMLDWAEAVFISAMVVQQKSFREVVARARAHGKKVVAGGPYATSFHQEIEGVDHLILGEAEEFFADFLQKLENGEAPALVSGELDAKGNPRRPDITKTPVPRYDLLKRSAYVTMAIQFSRGCPYNCEFCDITALYGRVPRTKTPAQVLTELQRLYDLNYRGSVFFVDDNFIGNRRNVLALLPELLKWQKERGFPFTFFTEASVNLAEMPELMKAMTDAGFNMVFLGIETPNQNVLAQTRKLQNVKQGNPDYLSWAVKTIQEAGLEVTAGFIVGLDGDTEDCFDSQLKFIQSAGISSAMVGLLTAVKGTDLYKRLEQEGRLLQETSGDNVSICLNYVPKMNPATLVNGYKKLLSSLYDPSLRAYFKRTYLFLKRWNLRFHAHQRIDRASVRAIFMSLFFQTFSRQGPAYLFYLSKILATKPKMFAQYIRLAIVGYHYEKITRQQVMIDDFRALLASERHNLIESITRAASRGGYRVTELQARLQESYARITSRYQQIHQDFRSAVDEALRSFHAAMEAHLEQLGEQFRPKLPMLMLS